MYLFYYSWLNFQVKAAIQAEYTSRYNKYESGELALTPSASTSFADTLNKTPY